MRPCRRLWFEYGNSGITVAQALAHLWGEHSTLLNIVPVILPVDNTLRASAIDDFERGSLLAQAKALAFTHGIFAQISCNDQGVIHVEQDGQLFPNAIPAGCALLDGDWTGDMTIERQPLPSCNFVNLSGFAFDGSTSTPLLSQDPGEVLGDMGSSEIDATRLILRGSGHRECLSRSDHGERK